MAATNEATRTETGPSASVYDGFISYSHAADDLLAPRLQAGLQRFAKPWWKRRALRMFRDESSLSANPHLWSSITEALDGSEWFVLLLSEEAARSDWVNREVEYWVEHKDPSRIIPVVTDGDFGWADGDVSGSACPPALFGVFADEPRWVDLRWAQSDTQLDLNNSRFSDAVADVASAIRGIPKDELASEEVRQHRRMVRMAWAVGIVVLLFGAAAAVGAVVAVGQSNEAQSQRDEAQRQARIASESEARARVAEAEALELAEDEAAARLEADENAETASSEAERANQEAERANQEAERAGEVTGLLLDFILQQTASGIEAPDPIYSEAADSHLPVPLLEAEAPPANTRLDFLHDFCASLGFGGGGRQLCFRDALFVDPAAQRGTPFWVADRPFHIRHGFANPAEADRLAVNSAVVPGYEVRVFVTRREGPELGDGAFELDRTYMFHSDYMVRETISNCGPDTEPQPCDLFVHDFPDGLPAGHYEIWVAWYAPCTAWVEDAELCLGVDAALNLFYSQADMRFFSEDYPAVNLEGDLPDCDCGPYNPGWPFEPWEWTRAIP